MADELNQADMPEESGASEQPDVAPASSETGSTASPSKDARTWMMLAHLSGLLGFIGPLIVWLIKKEEMPEVNDQGKEALNFQLTVLIAVVAVMIASAILANIPVLGLIFGILFMLLIWAISIGALVLIIIAAIKANEGNFYRYPFSLKLIK